jgi:hypothetical protein
MPSLLHIDRHGWNHDIDEPVCGGRCVECHQTLEECHAALADYTPVAERLWGPGELVITDEEGHLIHPPPSQRNLMVARQTLKIRELETQVAKLEAHNSDLVARLAQRHEQILELLDLLSPIWAALGLTPAEVDLRMGWLAAPTGSDGAALAPPF